MKHAIIILTAFCFCTITFSQENSLFTSQDQDLLDNLTIEKNDSSVLHKLLDNDKSAIKSTYSLPHYRRIYKRNAFLKSENSAIKDVMPVHEPKGKGKLKSIFPYDSIEHMLLVEPVNER